MFVCLQCGAGSDIKAFSWESPRLRDLEVDDGKEFECSRQFLKLVKESLVPFLAKGELSASHLYVLCHRLMEELKLREDAKDIYKSAYTAVLDCCAVITMLVDDAVGCRRSPLNCVCCALFLTRLQQEGWMGKRGLVEICATNFVRVSRALLPGHSLLQVSFHVVTLSCKGGGRQEAQSYPGPSSNPS